MEYLFIILASNQSQGEAIFVKVLSALTFVFMYWAVFKIRNKNKDKKDKDNKE